MANVWYYGKRFIPFKRMWGHVGIMVNKLFKASGNPVLEPVVFLDKIPYSTFVFWTKSKGASKLLRKPDKMLGSFRVVVRLCRSTMK